METTPSSNPIKTLSPSPDPFLQSATTYTASTSTSSFTSHSGIQSALILPPSNNHPIPLYSQSSTTKESYSQSVKQPSSQDELPNQTSPFRYHHGWSGGGSSFPSTLRLPSSVRSKLSSRLRKQTAYIPLQSETDWTPLYGWSLLIGTWGFFVCTMYSLILSHFMPFTGNKVSLPIIPKNLSQSSCDKPVFHC